MGCTSSKQSVCRNCHAQYSPVRMSYSSLPNPSPLRGDDNQHVVELTSTTLGYLLLDSSAKMSQLRHDPAMSRARQEPVRRNVPQKNSEEFAVGVIEAKTWSKMIDEKITKIVPKTPVLTPPGEPEMINTWELMEGLDDSSPLPLQSTTTLELEGPDDVSPLSPSSTMVEPEGLNDAGPLPPPSMKVEMKFLDDAIPPPPLSMTVEQELERISCVSFDNNPDSVPLDQSTLPSDSNSNDKSIASSFNPNKIKLKSLINEEHDRHDDAKKSLQTDENKPMSRSKEKLILYFTSLRGVRKTYDDCCHVRVILNNSGVRIDERDVSMHSGFKEELKELLGDEYNGGGLPKVFVGKKYIGGVDEIKRFHDEYQLDKVLEGCETVVDDCGGDGGGGGGRGCEACGDIRFLPCETCSGSCKVYYDVNSDVGEDEEVEGGDCGFQRCPDCNENGLIRCPICCN